MLNLVVHASVIPKSMVAYPMEKANGCDIPFHSKGFLILEMPHESIDAITTTFSRILRPFMSSARIFQWT
jgi:hypothetical protein